MTAEAPAGRGPIVLAVGGLVAALTLAGGIFLGLTVAGDDSPAAAPPAEDSVDVGFARDMRDHHAQAVKMSVMVRDATQDSDVRTLALDVLLTQQQQIGQMFAWLETWGRDQAGDGSRMSWMKAGDMSGMDMTGGGGMKGTGGAAMPGMATADQVAALSRASGERAERIYLQLMIPHHMAGVDMAQYAATRAEQPEVRRLAESIVAAQTSELKVLRSMLAERGGPVLGV